MEYYLEGFIASIPEESLCICEGARFGDVTLLRKHDTTATSPLLLPLVFSPLRSKQRHPAASERWTQHDISQTKTLKPSFCTHTHTPLNSLTGVLHTL